LKHTSWRDVLSVHPAAELFPRLNAKELVSLGEDIRTHGLRQPVVVLRTAEGDTLLDGISRLDAMEQVGGFELRRNRRGWEIAILDDDIPMGTDLYGVAVIRDVEPYTYVVSANIHRRHLTSRQKRDLIAKLLKADPSKSDRLIGDMIKADHKTVGTVRREVEATGEIPLLTKTKGADGKDRPARKAKKPTKPDKAAVPIEQAQFDKPSDKTAQAVACFEALAKLDAAFKKFPEAGDVFFELPVNYERPVSLAAVRRLQDQLASFVFAWQSRNAVKRIPCASETSPATIPVPDPAPEALAGNDPGPVPAFLDRAHNPSAAE
jgi:hypothetical protein